MEKIKYRKDATLNVRVSAEDKATLLQAYSGERISTIVRGVVAYMAALVKEGNSHKLPAISAKKD